MNRIKLYSLCCIATLFTSLSGQAIAEQKIISAGSSVTEIIERLGASQQLVAIDVTSEQPQGMSLPVVGYHRQLSAEGLLALHPTLLIGSNEMGPQTTLSTLKQAKVNIAVVDSDPTIEGLMHRINEIAELTDTQENAQQLQEDVNKLTSELQRNQPSKTIKIIFLLVNEGRPSTVAGNNTTPNTLIELIGGHNPASTLESYKPLSLESMVEMQPDIILVSERSAMKLGNAEGVLEKLPMLKATPAGQNKAILAIDGKALVGGLGLKTLYEAQRLQRIINPK